MAVEITNITNKNKIVISIPIELESRQDIASALLAQYDLDYLFMGRILQEVESSKSCQIDITPISDSKSNLSKLIEIQGQEKISTTAQTKINNSHQIVYLTSNNIGYQACVEIAKFAQIFLSIGGAIVNVESTGIVHEGSKWTANYDSQDVFDIYSLYVGLVEGEDFYYSCGMNNFGKADVAINLTEDIGLAIYVMNVFNYYRLTESPILQDGHTFQPDIESPRYKMQLVADDEHEIDSLQYNPNGRWHLHRI